MKHVVSISIGSSKRDKSVEIELLGEKLLLERIGTDGDLDKAAQLYKELDGKVDALGVGGGILGFSVHGKEYPFHALRRLTKQVTKTPVVDGTGLKLTLENRLAEFMGQRIADDLQPRRALITSAVDRYGMALSFHQADYDCIFGDLMFTFGIGIPIYRLQTFHLLAALILPIAGYLPIQWVYPIGEEQETRKPKWGRYFQWAKVIAGDCHMITHYMPDDLEGKIIVTNTTTPEDVALLRQARARYLVTSTPVLDGRSFGTNVMEAALVAISGKGRPLSTDELSGLMASLKMEPQLRDLSLPE
jgi:hypothetical protein